MRRPRLAEEISVFLASIAEDRTVRLWHPLIGRLVRFARCRLRPVVRPGLPTVAWSANGEQLPVGSNDGRVRVVDFETSQVTNEIVTLTGPIHELAREENEKSVFVGGSAGTAIVELNK